MFTNLDKLTSQNHSYSLTTLWPKVPASLIQPLIGSTLNKTVLNYMQPRDPRFEKYAIVAYYEFEDLVYFSINKWFEEIRLFK